MKLIHRISCWLGFCMQCRTESDDAACWGQCIHCGKRHGVTSRKAIQAYAEAEERASLRRTAFYERINPLGCPDISAHMAGDCSLCGWPFSPLPTADEIARRGGK